MEEFKFQNRLSEQRVVRQEKITVQHVRVCVRVCERKAITGDKRVGQDAPGL